MVQFSESRVATFENLVVQHEKPIFNIVYRIVGEREAAMDVTQSTFLKAYKNFDSYRPSFKFFSWVCKIAINESINYLSSRRRTVSLADDYPQTHSSPEDDFRASETDSHLQRALLKLTFDYRVALILRHFLDLSYSEMSRVLNVPEKTVKSRLFTGRQLLREILVGQGYAR